jgi:serine/threonine-protein kinase
MTSELAQGQLLADFEILSVAGTGGMGVVYRATQRSLGRVVALKVIRDEIARMPEYRERFLREARLAAAINHPHVVSVYDVGDEYDQLFLALQWIDGEDLKRLIERSGALAPDRAVAIASQLAGALDVLHGEAGMVHRDVKPANVLVRQVGGRDHAYLTDFGVAKPADGGEQLTQTGLVVGTAGYLAPEQIMGEEPGPRSDLYALGCVFFEALTGKPPFQAKNELALRWAHANDPRPTASSVLPALGERYNQFFAVALAVDPQQRFRSGADFVNALDLAQDRQASIETEVGPLPPHARTAIGPPTPLPPRTHTPTPAPIYPGYGYATPPPAYQQQSRSGSPLALIVLGIVALAGIVIGALAAGGVFSRAAQTAAAAATVTQSASPAGPSPLSTTTQSPTTQTTTTSTPSPAADPSTGTFSGHAFSISYPSGWSIEDAEKPESYGTDTTFVSPSDPNMILRVDVQANPPTSDPMAAAQPVINQLQQEPGYSQIDLSRTTFEGFPAVHWEFTVEESGELLQKEDVFFTDTANGDSVAVLTAAPASEYGQLANQFANLMQSLTMN